VGADPRRRSARAESPEDPDLAPFDAGPTASEDRHELDLELDGELPFIHPGQLTVFDLLGGSDGSAS
jgi:hypothetical protein